MKSVSMPLMPFIQVEEIAPGPVAAPEIFLGRKREGEK